MNVFLPHADLANRTKGQGAAPCWRLGRVFYFSHAESAEGAENALLRSHGLFPSILNLHYYSSDKQLDSDDGINLRNRCSALQRSSVSSCSLAILDNTL